MTRRSIKNKRWTRGGAALMVSFVVASLLALSGAANVAWVGLKESQAERQVQKEAAQESNRATIELLAQMLERNILVAFYVPGSPPVAAPVPEVPTLAECTANPSLPACKCTPGQPGCVVADTSSEGGSQVPKSQDELKAACQAALPPTPDCEAICEAKNCFNTCDNDSNFKDSTCTSICDHKADADADPANSPSEVKSECQSYCQNKIPPPPDCTLCVPDPDSKTGCTGKSSLPTDPTVPPPPSLSTMAADAADSVFKSGNDIVLTSNPALLKALPPGASFTAGYLTKAKIDRKVINPKRIKRAQDASEQRLSSGAVVGDVACAKDPSQCLSQISTFGNVTNSASGDSGSIEVQTSTALDGLFAGPPVVSRAKVHVAEIGPAPLPTCKITASPALVYSNAAFAGAMWTVLTLTPKVTPNFPELITSTNIAGLPFGPGGGARVVPYPYGYSSYAYYGSVTGPGGSSACAVTVSSVCLPRSPVCVPGKCWYPVDNFPRCLGWIVCPEGEGCWYRGEVLGCFAPDTKLDVGNGLTATASNLKVGDELWNPARKKLMRIAKVIVGPEAEPLVEIGFDKTVVRVSTKHPVITKRGLKRADEVTTKDEIQGADLKYHQVTTLTRSAAPATKISQTVVNFELDTTSTEDEDHYVVANGIVTGDNYLQNELARRKTRHGKK